MALNSALLSIVSQGREKLGTPTPEYSLYPLTAPLDVAYVQGVWKYKMWMGSGVQIANHLSKYQPFMFLYQYACIVLEGWSYEPLLGRQISSMD